MKTKIILNAVLPLVVSILLFFLVGVIGISKISELVLEVKSARNDQTTLSQKLSLLSTFSETTSTGIDVVTNALPDTDPILSVLTQLRSLAGINGVTISGISSGASDVGASGLNESNISFNVLGPMNQIVSFLTGTQSVSPIIVLNKVDVVQRDSIFEASVTAKSFWSPLPSTIPALTEAVTDLTDSEKQTLVEVSGLTQPILVEPSGVASGSAQEGINPNPFGQ